MVVNFLAIFPTANQAGVALGWAFKSISRSPALPLVLALTPINAARRHALLVCVCMDDFRIDPPLVVKDTPKPRRLASLADARDFVAAAMHVGRPPAWREMYNRLRAVRSEDEASEAIGALRELLELEDLLVPPKLPLTSQGQAEH
jgi:hypothetical protein